MATPPWFTYGSIKNHNYQATLDAIAVDYDVKPGKAKNYANLEIAAIFLAYCSSYFLMENGQFAFVLPRSFLSADHHDNTRKGQAKGFSIRQIWDLDNVSPLFRVPSCVLLGKKVIKTEKGNENRVQDTYSFGGISGKVFSGTLPFHNCNWNSAINCLTAKDQEFFYLKQGNSSAFSTRKASFQKANAYKKLFRKGADIIPRSFYFVELDQEEPSDFNDRIINVRTDSKVPKKKPWNKVSFSGRHRKQFHFPHCNFE